MSLEKCDDYKRKMTTNRRRKREKWLSEEKDNVDFTKSDGIESETEWRIWKWRGRRNWERMAKRTDSQAWESAERGGEKAKNQVIWRQLWAISGRHKHCCKLPFSLIFFCFFIFFLSSFVLNLVLMNNNFQSLALLPNNSLFLSILGAGVSGEDISLGHYLFLACQWMLLVGNVHYNSLGENGIPTILFYCWITRVGEKSKLGNLGWINGIVVNSTIQVAFDLFSFHFCFWNTLVQCRTRTACIANVNAQIEKRESEKEQGIFQIRTEWEFAFARTQKIPIENWSKKYTLSWHRPLKRKMAKERRQQ